MSCNSNSPNVNKTFIIEPLSLTGGSPTLSACTALFTNLVESCSGDTSIQMGTGLVTFNSNVNGINSFTANTIEATTYLSGGTNILDIVNANDTFITGGTFSDVSDSITLSRNDGANIVITGLTNYYVTGGTYNNNTGLITFNRNDALSAFTVDLNSLDLNDTFTTGATLTNGILTLSRNDGTDIVITGFSQTFTGNTSGDCITDLYVSRIHSCSPLHINPNDEGKIYFGSTSAITIDLTNPSISIGGEDVSDNTTLQVWTSGSTQRAIRMRDKVTNSQFNFWTTTADTGENILKLDEDTSGSTVAIFYGTGIIKSNFDGDGSRLYNIPISGVTNLLTELGNKTDNDSFTAHTGDTTIHFTKSSINLSDLGSSAHTHTLNDITNFNVYSATTDNKIDSKVGQILFDSHTGDTNNPHQTSFSNLTSTAHTHTLNDITNFNTYSGDVETLLNTKISGATNLSSEGFFTQKNGFNLEFKGLTSTGDTVNISSNSNSVNLEVILPTDQDKFVSGGTYNTGTQDINFVGNSPETTFDIDLSSLVTSISGDTFITGQTFSNSTYILTSKRNDGVTFNTDLSVLATDVYVVSGVYNPLTGIVTYTNSSGGTFQVSGFTTGMTDSYTTSANLNGETIEFNNNIQGSNLYNVNLSPILSGKTDLTLFNSHTGDTNNPHQTSFSNLTSTAHTHTLSDITDFNSYSGSVQTQIDSKLDTTTFNTYSGNVQTQLNSKIENGVNSGGANELFSGKSGTDLYFRTLSGGTNTTISTINDVIRVDVSVPVDTNTFVTGGTYNPTTDIVTLTRNDAVTIDITGVTSSLWSSNVNGIHYDNGNVGIGVSNPTFNLDVVSSGGTTSFEDIARFRTIDSTDYLALTNAISTDGTFNPVLRAFNNTNVSTNFYLQSVIDPSVDTGVNPLIMLQGRVSTDPGNVSWSGVTTRPIIRVRNNSSNLLDITADGNVGIGTSTPDCRLHVSDTKGNLKVRIDDENGNSTNQLFLTSAENTYTNFISIGTPTLNAELQFGMVGPSSTSRVVGNPDDSFIAATSAADNMNFINNAGVGTTDNIAFYAGKTLGTDLSATTSDIIILGDGTDRGYVGIGTDTPTEKLEVSGNTKISGTLNIGTLGTGTSVNNLGIDVNGNVVIGTTGGTDTNTYVTGFTYNNVNTFTLSRNGALSDLTSTISVLSGITYIGATTISGSTYYGNGENLTGVVSRSIDSLTTTGDSVNTISTLSNIDDNSTTFIESYVTAHNNSNNYGFWKRTIAVNKNGGSINIIRERADFDSQSSGLTPTNVVYSASSGNLLILVSGETGKTYNWVSKWEII